MGSLGAGVTGGSELIDVNAENQITAQCRAIHGFKHLEISPDLLFILGRTLAMLD